MSVPGFNIGNEPDLFIKDSVASCNATQSQANQRFLPLMVKQIDTLGFAVALSRVEPLLNYVSPLCETC